MGVPEMQRFQPFKIQPQMPMRMNYGHEAQAQFSLMQQFGGYAGYAGHFVPAVQRPKKQIQFNSREDMIKYIENFRTNYKTELCKNFMETGFCEFNDECAYAHGLGELNLKQKSHKNYKTKMCKKWHVETPG
jgi:hypothetical protein